MRSCRFKPDLRGVILLNQLNWMLGRVLSALVLHLPEALDEMDDHVLHDRFITETFQSGQHYRIPGLDNAIGDAIEHFRILDDCKEEGEHVKITCLTLKSYVHVARFYNAIAEYHLSYIGDLERRRGTSLTALSLALNCNAEVARARALGGTDSAGIIKRVYGSVTKVEG